MPSESERDKLLCINFDCGGSRILRLMAHREGGGRERERERTQHSLVERETNNCNLIIMHQFDCGGCRKSASLLTVRERENI
jgi:hypothetical protein